MGVLKQFQVHPNILGLFYKRSLQEVVFVAVAAFFTITVLQNQTIKPPKAIYYVLQTPVYLYQNKQVHGLAY